MALQALSLGGFAEHREESWVGGGGEEESCTLDLMISGYSVTTIH